MSSQAVRESDPSVHEFILRWSHRLFRGYGFWVFANLLFYVVFLMMVCKGTFPGGFKGVMTIVMQALMVSGGCLLGLSCCSAYALSSIWKAFFPQSAPGMRFLWYLTVPLPFLQVWGYLALCWKNLRNRRIWSGVLLLGTAGVIASSVLVLSATSMERLDHLGWVALSFGLTLLVQARLFWVTAGMQYTRMRFRLMMSIGGLTAFAVFAPLYLTNQADRRLEWVRGQLEALGVPGDIGAAEKAYYQGTEPDQAWNDLALLLQNSELSENLEQLKVAPPKKISDFQAGIPEIALMLKLSGALALGDRRAEKLLSRYAETSSSVQRLNQLVDQKKLLRCRWNYDMESLSPISESDLKIGRSCACFFTGRGHEAVRQGKYNLAESYWRRCCVLADELASLPDGRLSVLGGGFAVERTALRLAKDIIDSGRLNADELVRWKNLLSDRQKKYISWGVSAMKYEPLHMLEFARRGIPTIRQYRYRNWAGASMFCYIQNDLFTGLNIQAYILRDILQPGWRPTHQKAYDGAGFQALNYMKGMTFTSMLLEDVRFFLEKGEELCSLADLAVIRAEIELFRSKHGRLPQKLEEMEVVLPKDLFSGRFYHYAPEKNHAGYLLWGVGMNRQNDGGLPGKDVLFSEIGGVTAKDRQKTGK